MYDVITIGGAVRDFTFYIDQEKRKTSGFICFPADAKINIDDAYFTHGGGACNVAVGLANFGLKTAIITRIGRDHSGQAILEKLKEKKVETRFVQIDKRSHTGVSVIIQPRGGGRTIFTFRGANDNLQITNFSRLGIKTGWVYVASLSGNWEKVLDKIFRYYHHIVWNPGNLQLKSGKKRLANFLKKTEVLVLNRAEISLLTRKSEKNVPELLKSLYRLGPKIVVATCGKNGAYVMDKNEILYEPARPVKKVDTTGAGDAFSSGFLAGLILFNNIKKALKLGIYNSAAVLTQIGAQEGLLTKIDLGRFFN